MPRSSSPPPPRSNRKRRWSGSTGRLEPEIGLHEQRLADPTGPDQIDQRAVRRQEPAPDRLHEEDALATRLVHHPAGLTRVEGERLLAEHVLAPSEQGEGVLHVARLRSGDVHHFDFGVFGQRGVVAIAGPNTETISEGVGALGGSRRDGDDLPAVDHLHCVGEAGRDGARPHHAPTDHRLPPFLLGAGPDRHVRSPLAPGR